MLLFTKSVLRLAFTGYEARYPVVTVYMEDKTFQLMLDTGSSGEAVALTREALSLLDVTFTGRRRVYRDAYGGLSESREFIIPSVRLGEFEVRNVLGNERHYNVYGLDGAIGLDLLSAFDVLIDYPGRTLVLYRRDRDPAFLSDGGWSRCSFAGNLTVRVGLGDRTERFWFGVDTGCGCNLVSRSSELGALIAAEIGRKAGSFRLGRRRARECSSYRVDHLYLDDCDLGGCQLVLSALPSYMNDGLIGYDFFARYLVYITFRKQEIWFKPASREGPSLPVYGSVLPGVPGSGVRAADICADQLVRESPEEKTT